MQVTAELRPPWGTVALAGGNVAVFVLAGSAPDYAGASIGGEREVPSISRLLFDILRHPDLLVLAVTLLVFVPVSAAVERVVGAVGIAATYLVGGFFAGFVEVLARSDDITVVGAFGGTTALLAIWTVTRWRQRHDVLLAVAVVAGWAWSMTVFRPDGVPLLGAAVAAWVGLYGIDATRAWRRPTERR